MRNRTRGSWLVVLLLVPGFGTCGADRASSPPASVAPAEPYGWYEFAPGERVFVTWGPRGGLRMLDFDRARFGSLAARDSGAFEWAPARGAALRIRFGPRGFQWRDTTGASGFAERATEAPYDAERVQFRSGDVSLAGTLLVPRVRKLVGAPDDMREVPVQLPGAVVIHGSGESDRDNMWAYHHAQQLARAGVIVLMPDKRGSGASGGEWRTADFAVLAQDALAGVDVLLRDERVDAERIGLLGLSQGGWIAPLAAAGSPHVAWLIDVSGAAVSVFEQVRHEVANDFRAAGLEDGSVDRLLEVVDLSLAWARGGGSAEWARYDAARGALLAGPLAPVAASFPADSGAGLVAWLRLVGDVDAMTAWSSFGGPALVVYGAEDERDNVPVAESVRRLRALDGTTLEICVFPGVGHALADETGWIDPDVLALLADWIDAFVGGPVDVGAASSLPAPPGSWRCPG